MQRWLNRDPIAERGGINLYGYVYSEPVNRIDPFGLLTPEEIEILQAEANGTSQLIAQKQAEIQRLASQVQFWRDAANTAAKGGSDIRGVCTGIYNGLRADFANANADLRQLQDQLHRIRNVLAGAGGAGALAAGGLYATASGVFTAPTVGASFTGFGVSGGVLAGGAVLGAAAVAGGLGYAAGHYISWGGENLHEHIGGWLYKVCPSCF